MDPIRVGQFSLGGAQRLVAQHQAVPTPGVELTQAAIVPAASVAGGVNELRSISSRIAEIERAGFQAMARRDQIDDASKLLAELRSIIKTTSANEADAQADLADTKARFDDILSQVTRLEEGSPLRASNPLSPTQNQGVVAADVSWAIDKFSFGADLKPGESRDIDVQVLASAQVAGFLLSFGGDNLNLGGATEQFVIRLEGNAGSQELTFASGTSIVDIASAINSFANSTGVVASVSGTTGIRLSSTDYGSSQFVSVQIVDDGGIGSAFRRGIYRLDPNDADEARTNKRTTFASASNAVTDKGQDVTATINGVAARSNGRQIRARVDSDVWVDLLLSDNRSINGGSALSLGKIDALTLSRPAETPAAAGPTPDQVEDLQQRLDQLLNAEQTAARSRGEMLSQLVAQMRGTVSAQTGATPADFNAAGAAAALRQGLLGQPAPTPPPPSGGIEPKRSVELLTDRE